MNRDVKKNSLPDHAWLQQVAAWYGTPLYVFSRDQLEQNIAGFLAPFQQARIPHQVFYACKANSNLAILQVIRHCGLNVEVNSPGELYQVLRAGFHPQQILCNGVAKSDAELARAVQLGIFCINVDNLSELAALARLTAEQKKRCRIALRLIPDIRDGGHPGLETGIRQSKFGMHRSLISEACRIIRASPGLQLVGIHGHIGSQLCSSASFSALISQLKEFRREIEQETGEKIRSFNIGGGFPVDYLHRRPGTDNVPAGHLAEFVRSFTPGEVAEILRDCVPRDVEIFMEPGRSIVGSSAVLLAGVVRRKQGAGSDTDWLLLDAGFNTLLEGFSYNWYFHMIAVGREEQPYDTGYLVGGPLCDGGDIFPVPGNGDSGFHRLLPASMQEGDLVAFLDTGAYTLEQMTLYNGRLPAVAVMVEADGSMRTIRKRFTQEDLVRCDVEL